MLVILMVGSAIQQIGISFENFTQSESSKYLSKIELAKQKVLKVDWKPISVFPEEAKRFR